MAEKFNIKELTPERYGQFLIYTLKTTRRYGRYNKDVYRVAIVDANSKKKLEDFVPGGNEGVSDYDAPITKETVIVAMKKYIDSHFKNYSSNEFMPKVGDVFYTSWGYDQTNHNFVRVTEVGSSTVKVREIEAKESEEIGFMNNHAVYTHKYIGAERLFKIDAFYGELTLRGRLNEGGQVHTWHKVKPGQTFLNSHYA